MWRSEDRRGHSGGVRVTLCERSCSALCYANFESWWGVGFQDQCENQKSLTAVMGASKEEGEREVAAEVSIDLQTVTLEAEGEAAVAVLNKVESFQWQDGAVDSRPDCSDSDTYEECLAETFYAPEVDIPEAPQKQTPRSG